MKRIVFINNNLFILDFRGGKVNVFTYEDKLKRVNLKKEPQYQKDVTTALILSFKKDILNKIKNGEYKNINDIKSDLLSYLKKTQIDGLDDDFENNLDFIKTVNELNYEFEKANVDVEQKEEIIEETLKVNLRTLFQSHGINEFKIDDTKSAVIYEKDGIPHVLTHTNPNANIYEMVLRSLEFDKLHSKEELDAEIDKSFESEKDRFNNHDTRRTYEILNKNIMDITDYLRKNYDIKEIFDVMPSNDNTIGESLLVDYGKGWQLLTIQRDNNGVIKAANFGTRKDLDNEKNVTPAIQDIKTETISDDLSNEARDNQIKEILIKLYGNEDLSSEDKQVINYYSDEQNFYTLSKEAREMFLQITEIYKSHDKEVYDDEKVEKVYKLEMPKKEDNSAFTKLTVVTFLSGLLSGALVYMFLSMLV